MADKKVELNEQNLEEVAGGLNVGKVIDGVKKGVEVIGTVTDALTGGKKDDKKEDKKGDGTGGGQTNTINGAGGKQQNNQNVNYNGAVNNSF